MRLFGVLIPEKEQLITTLADVVKGRAGLSLYASLFGLVIGFYAIAAIFIQGAQKRPQMAPMNSRYKLNTRLFKYFYQDLTRSHFCHWLSPLHF